MFELKEQVALITGASRGIGRAIAERLAQAGAHVVLASRRREDVDQVAESLRGCGYAASATALDVSDAEQSAGCVERVVDHFERIDILVNNAGITRDSLLLRMKPEDWRSVMQTNLDGAFYLTKAVLPRMIRSRYGRVINISSVVGQMGNVGQAGYAASKAGIIGFTKALAREVASREITVNAVAPGYIETDMTRELNEKAKLQMLESIPLKRIGTASEVAAVVHFLASKEAGYITGHVLNINGGMYM